MNNALKHSNGDAIKIQLKQDSDHYTLIIQDNGSSHAKEIKTSGLGLKNMKMRAKRIGGVLHIDFEKGCKVILKT